jgi:hypothetical protein
LSNWIKAAKDGRFALPADVAFVPVVINATPNGLDDRGPSPALPTGETIEITVADVVVQAMPNFGVVPIEGRVF